MKKLPILLLCLALAIGLLSCAPQPASTSGTGTPTQSVPADHTHSDRDNDGLCNSCGESVLVSIAFYAINDLHGKFLDSDIQPGVDELSSYLLATNPDTTVLLSSGDMWQGSSESNLTHGNLMTEWMNALDFAAMTLGNHEFDWGESYVEANARLAEFPLLAINIYDRETNTPVSYCSPSALVERRGVQIGIIGAIGDCYSSIFSDKTEDIYFKTGSELTKLVKDEALRLREAGADIIVYSLHDGYEGSPSGTVSSLGGYYDPSLSEYVDLVFEGHIHKRYAFTDSYGVYHLQGGGENSGLSYACVTYNTANGGIVSVNGSFVSSDVYDDHDPHPIVEELLDKYQEALAPGQAVLGTNGRYRESTELRELIARLYYEAGAERWGTDYDIALGGGFISIRNPWNLSAGQVTYGKLQALFPFDNQLVLCSVKGDSLLQNFLETNNDNYFVYPKTLEGIDPKATYYIVTDTYCSSFAPNRLTVVAEYDPGVYARDLLADYISSGGLENEAVPGDYTLTDISTLLRLCAALAPGETSAGSYFVRGTIVSVASSTYGNVTIQDENGNRIYVYGIYDATGTVRYDSLENPPKAGDTVILMGQLQNYVSGQGQSTYELVRARLLEIQ